MRLATLIFVLAAFVASAEQQKNDLSNLPQWQRVLKGEDAKAADKLLDAIDELQEADKYADAIKMAEDLVALRIRLQGADHFKTIDAKHDLAALAKVAALPEARRRDWRTAMKLAADARSLEKKANYAEALALKRKILEWRIEILGEDHPDTGESYNSLAYNLDAQGKFTEAQPIHRKALEIRRSALGEDHPNTAIGYSNLAYNLAAQGKAVEARPLHEKALEIRRRVRGEDHPDTAASHSGLARNLDALGKLAEAQPHLEKALEIIRRIRGEDHPDTAASYNSVALNLDAQGKAAEAQPIHRKALEIRRRILGDDHPDTVSSYNNMACNLGDLGMLAEAVPLFRKALEIRCRVLGENHPFTATSYNNLGIYLNGQGKAAEAEPLIRKALEIRRRALGEDHPDTATSYNCLADNLSYQGKDAEALPLHWKALEIRRRALREDHPDTATCYTCLAVNLDNQGKAAEAEPFFRIALEIRRRAFGENHADTAHCYHCVAANLQVQGKAAEAEPLFRKALEIRLRVFGEDHIVTAASINGVAVTLQAQGKAAEASLYFGKALAIRLRILGEDHPDTATSYNLLANNMNALGKAAEALPRFRKALEIRRRTRGEIHPDTAVSYNNVAFNLCELGNTAEAKSILQAAVSAYESSRLSAAEGIDRASLQVFSPRLFLAALHQGDEPVRAWKEVELSMARSLLDRQAGPNRLTDREEADLSEHRSRFATVQSQLLLLAAKADRTVEESARMEGLLKVRKLAEESIAALAVKASTREVADPEAIRSALSADSALLFWVDVYTTNGDVEERFACVVRPAGDPHWERLPGTGPGNKWSKADGALPVQYRKALASRPDEVPGLAKKLHAQRIAPVLKHLDGVSKLHCLAVHEMAGIPVEALTHDFTISYIPSGTFLARLKDKPKPKSDGFLAFGDPVFENPNDPKPKGKPTLPPGGLLLTSVLEGGGADKAGLRTDHVLLKYAGIALASVDTLKEQIAAHAKDGKSIPVEVWIEGNKTFKDVAPGPLGVNLAVEPAPTAIAERRKMDTLLRSARNRDWVELPGSRAELAAIKRHFGDKAAIHADSDASEQKLEELRKAGDLTKYRYLHFATHGEGNSVRAFESALILAQDKLPKELMSKPGEPFLNGQLSAREVLDHWKLDAELVTLSACETAIGKSGGGDGLLGFAQAFLTAGARSVCLSLWKVDDAATALLMDRFYGNLKAGKPKAVALSEAKNWLRNLDGEEATKLYGGISNGVPRAKEKALDVKEGPKPVKGSKPYAHPKYWAAFILIGDPN